VSARTEATSRDEAPTDTFDFEAVFHTHFRRIARVIVRVIQDPSRAALDELRRRTRREKYERWFGFC